MFVLMLDFIDPLFQIFDINPSEKANDGTEQASFTEIIFGNQAPLGGNKRCVYRGSGAICNREALGMDNSKIGLKKLFSCAPNFYCESLDQPEFNKEVVRDPNNVQTFLYGKEADILGRPKNLYRSE